MSLLGPARSCPHFPASGPAASSQLPQGRVQSLCTGQLGPGHSRTCRLAHCPWLSGAPREAVARALWVLALIYFQRVPSQLMAVRTLSPLSSVGTKRLGSPIPGTSSPFLFTRLCDTSAAAHCQRLWERAASLSAGPGRPNEGTIVPAGSRRPGQRVQHNADACVPRSP